MALDWARESERAKIFCENFCRSAPLLVPWIHKGVRHEPSLCAAARSGKKALPTFHEMSVSGASGTPPPTKNEIGIAQRSWVQGLPDAAPYKNNRHPRVIPCALD